jgi:hypothetical protein
VDSDTLYHYVIIRSDLPHGVQLAQTIHAAGESCDGPLPTGTYAIALSVDSEFSLHELAAKLWAGEIPHRVIIETDGKYAGQSMAIGCFPTSQRDIIRKYTSDLPLAR